MVRILTGTWEEIKAHDAELAGRQMKVVVNDASLSIDPDATSARLLAFDAWVNASRQQEHFLLDDSRASIYGEDQDRG